jgi:outer membrane cobalamin receptor
MKTLKLTVSLAAVALFGIGTIAAEPLADAVSGKKNDGSKEKLVFVTGSRIPKRVKVKAIGTNTTSPVRVYTRAEIDRTGRFTTAGILAQDPSVQIIGNGSH